MEEPGHRWRPRSGESHEHSAIILLCRAAIQTPKTRLNLFSLPAHAVFEIDTETNSVRVCLSKQQLEISLGVR